ncbi:MAG: hypothetical protein ACYS7Y_34175 [Planctomycetota bacterium]
MSDQQKQQPGQSIAREGQGSYSGDMILQSDAIMGKDEGVYNKDFSHVSGIWLKNGCMSFDAAKEQLASEQQQIEDFHTPLSEWDVVVVEGGIAFKHLPTDRDFQPTDHALNLLCQVGKGLSVSGWQGSLVMGHAWPVGTDSARHQERRGRRACHRRGRRAWRGRLRGSPRLYQSSRL